MQELLSVLACPRDHTALRLGAGGLTCAKEHTYPVVEGIPVLLVTEDTPTIGIATASIAHGRQGADGQGPEDPWFTSTLGISEGEKARLLEQAASGVSPIDPVVRFLVGATNGILYRDLVGALSEYPIPELRLPDGRGESLLDIGCSWGRWSIAAARKGYRTVGIDPSLGAVLAAQRVCRDLRLDSTFVVGDARRLPFFDSQFQAVISYSVIQHFAKSDARISVGEIGRVLAPEGRSLIQMANRFGIRSLYHQVRRGFRDATGFEVRYWSPDELRQMCDAGIGTTRLTVDCFFGLGLQASDGHLMPPLRRFALRASEYLRSASSRCTWLQQVADSLYAESIRATREGRPS